MTFTSVQHSVRAPSVGRFRARGAASFRVPATSTYRNRVIANATLEKGSKLTDFPNFYKVLLNQDGETRTLSSYKGKSSLVVFFYPKAGTPGCTAEACSFRDAFERFEKAGVQVFGISGDSPEENKAFKQAQNLQFDLLSDANNILRKEFGIKNEMFVLPGRQTYVIDKDGTCVTSFNDMMNTSQHVTEALKALGL